MPQFAARDIRARLLEWSVVRCVAGLLLVTGCSYYLHPPRVNATPADEPACSQSAPPAAIAADLSAGIASVYAVSGIHCLSKAFPDDGEEYSPHCDFNPVALLAAIPWALSAMRGIEVGHACNCAWERHQAHLAEMRLTPAEREEKLRRELARDAAASIRRSLDERECAGPLEVWRAERDLRRRTELWESLPARCRAVVARGASGRK